MTVDVVNSQNEKVGSLDLRDEVFGGRVKTDLIHESVVRANAAERRGTHATKTRAMVGAARARNPGGRRGPDVRASARFAIRSGATEQRRSGRSRAATTTTCRSKEKFS